MSLGWSALIPARNWRHLVSGKTIKSDLVAGLTGATIVLPQGVAFATIAGLPAEYGLFTAMITPVVAALFGSSLVMVSGPTTAISAVLFSTLAGSYEPFSVAFVQMALTITLVVGAIQIALGYAGLGRLVTFVSHSVMIGFTAVAAVLIAASQLGDAMGVKLPRGEAVYERVVSAFEIAPDLNWRALAVTLTTLLAAVLARKLAPRLPTFLIAIIIGGLLAWALDGAAHGVAMVGSLSSVVPDFSPPSMSLAQLASAAEAGFAIALIGLLEAISIGRAFAAKDHKRFDADQEIIGQGMSNLVGGLFQAYPGSGSFTRSGLNYDAGARTPMAAIFSSMFLLFILLLFAPIAAFIPIPALAGVILYVAWKLIAWREIATIMRTSGTESTIIIATLLAGLLVKLEFAIYVGVILSLFFFLSRSSRPTLAISAPDKDGVFRNAQVYELPECPQIVFARLDGPLYFGSAEAIERAFRQIERQRPGQRQMILVLKGVGDVDLPGADVLAEESSERRAAGGGFSIVARFPPFVARLRKLRLIERIGEENLYPRKFDAIAGVVAQLDDDRCTRCSARIFEECAFKPGGAEFKKKAEPKSELESLTHDV